MIWVLQTAAGLVLLIACANLASLVLARAESRRREFAVRAALGASRGRLIQQTITEGALLSVAGGAIGLWVARLGLRSLVLAYPTSLPRTSELTIDLPVLLFALVVSVATGVLFGVAPAVQSRFIDLVDALKEGNRDGGTAGRHRVRRALVTAEVALAVMLVIGAGLLVRTVYNLTRVDAGFDRSRMVTFSMTLPRSGPRQASAPPRFSDCSTRFVRFRACRPPPPCPICRSTGWPSDTTPGGELHQRRRQARRGRGLLPVRDVGLLQDDAHPDRGRPRLRRNRHDIGRPGRHHQ